MVGLPTEQEADVEATAELLIALKKATPGLRLSLGVSSFVPKAHTPFQWEGVRPEAEKRLKLLAKRLNPKGIELRPEQVEANRAQVAIAADPAPEWRVGDARNLGAMAEDVSADLIFSCPPYWNLERYSDDPADLSTMDEPAFFEAQAGIIAAAVARLKEDRFAVWVVGDVRDDSGFYVNLPGRTVEAFEAAGARFYNEAILVTAVGSLPIRTGRQFTAARKLGRTHQSVLVFVKGDPRRATEACGGRCAAILTNFDQF
jgi:hypothetical protein